jgi:folate-dependent phosphoribosylglycinamide formyltransferase PurN
LETPRLSGRPIRVVFFGGGPQLERGARRFLERLESHPDIDLVGAYCQSEGRSIEFVVRDLWRRRGALALPLLVAWAGSEALSALRDPRGARRLRTTISALSERLRYVTDIHAPDVLAEIRALAPDLGVLYGAPILRPELFEIPAEGTLGIHHGALPRYRGKKTTFWEMYHGEPTAGVTIQLINRGLDTGSTVNEGSVPIGSRSRGAVWRDLEHMGLDLYVDAILQVREGTSVPRAQEGPKGPLFRDPPLRLILALWWRQTLKSVLKRSPGPPARDATA